MGIYVGMDVRLGVVKNFNEIRDHFMDCPKVRTIPYRIILL